MTFYLTKLIRTGNWYALFGRELELLQSVHANSHVWCNINNGTNKSNMTQTTIQMTA